MSKGKEAGKIQVYVRVRPFTERERDKREANAIEIHQEHSLIRVLDPRSRTNYFFDGVFSPEASNQEVYFRVGKPLVYAALNGYKGTLLTYGQTGTGKTFTLLSDDGVTTRVVQHCFEKIDNDEIHNYKVMCSFLQVYQEKVYDLLNPRFIVDLPVREHPKKGVYVANLTQHEVKSAGDVFALLEIGKQHLVIAETKMVRQSSRSHSIMQLIIERRLKAHIANEKPVRQSENSVSHEAVQESIMAVDETINNLIKELKQERKSHHKHERECLKELMEKELNNGNTFEGDLIVKGKINLCDLAGSERLTKTKAEGVRLTEAKYLNTSLLELGNVIHALARGQKRHVPYRNSTLTRLLQDCLGDNGKTNFIICIAPALSEVNETKCSLNFGLRAMRITNVARLNVEVDYKVLAERLAKKLEDQDIKYKIEKLEYLREIQRLKSAITCYQESENFAGKDHEKLVSVIANLSKSVQREKEEKNNLQTELVCLKKQVSQPIGTCAPDVDAVLLAELVSMELLANLHHPDMTKNILADSSLPTKIKNQLASVETQEALLYNTGCFLQLLDLHLDTEQNMEEKKLATAEAKEYLQFNFSRAGSVELFSKDCSIKISPRGVAQEPCLSLPMSSASSDENGFGLAGGVRRMLGKLMGRDSKDRVPPPSNSSHSHCACVNGRDPESLNNTAGRVLNNDQQALAKTKSLMKQLVSSKEKVEQQVLTLMSSLFGEQIIRTDGQSLQWNELGKKLTKLIMFRRNNMPGLSDADLWPHSDDFNAILENCLRFVIIDKALLACLLVVEILDLRQTCGKTSHKTSPHGPQREVTVDRNNKEMKSMVEDLFQDVQSTNNSQNETVKEGIKSPPENDNKATINKQKSGLVGVKGGKREELKNLKDVRYELEKEINEMHEDTTKLETELFSTMEEKTKVEEELFGVKHHVTKLRSELFHLKLEKSNLEGDVKKSKTMNNAQGDPKLVCESPREAPRLYPELSDVMEASHESNDSENSSQMSDGHESRETFLKTCMENISKIYTIMPNPEDGVHSEGDLSDDQEPTFSDANIDDSDEEIIITKLARSLRSPCRSPAKEKLFDTSPSSKNEKKEAGKADYVNDTTEDLGSKSKEALIKQIEELKRKLQKVEQELVEVREANEDLDYELDHKKGQLAEAQETITNLENQVMEEKENCEQLRQLYFDVKTQNEILEGKFSALRSELERVLIENNAANGFERALDASRKTAPPTSPTKGSGKSPGKSPGKSGKGRGSKIDLRTPPESQRTTNEIEMIGLWEENAELKVKFGKAYQEKIRLEKLLKGGEEKVSKMKAALQSTEETTNRLKEDVAASTKEKIRLSSEVTDLRNENSNITEELNKYREKSTRLEKDIEVIAYMSTRLEKDNKILENEISKMESELATWKSKHESVALEFQRLDKESMEVAKEKEQERLELEALRKEKAQLLEQRFSAEEERQKKEIEMKEHEERFLGMESDISEQKRLNMNLQKELAGMAEYQEALENEYCKAKNEEERLKQELAKANLRMKEVEKELALGSQKAVYKRTKDYERKYQNNLKNMTKNPRKHELDKKVKSITGTPTKKFYTITHTSEDEIADSSSSIAESPADDAKQLEHENQLLKLENGYLQQQLSESEQVLAMYRQDLEGAQDLIDKLQAEVKTPTNENAILDNVCKPIPSENGTITDPDDFFNTAQDDYKLLEEKHAELTREYEALRKQYHEAVTEKVTTETQYTDLKKEFQGDENSKEEFSNSEEDANRLRAALEEKIDELKTENDKLKVTVKQLDAEAQRKQELQSLLKNAQREKNSLEERLRNFETENEKLKIKMRDGKRGSDDDSKRLQLKLEERLEFLELENRRLKEEIQVFIEESQNTSFKLQQTTDEEKANLKENELNMRKLEEDLLKATSEKLKFEFELKSANTDRERLRSDLLQSESEKNLLTTQLNDNIERAANLEISLMEMRCSCETIKEEINTLKDQKRQESLHLHETSICKEMLEKRLEEALKEKNRLRHELDNRNEERREEQGKIVRLEQEREQFRKETDELRKLNCQSAEKTTAIERVEEQEENQTLIEQVERLKQENHYCQKELAECKAQKENGQEKLKALLEQVASMAEEHEQIKSELEEIKEVKRRLEEQQEKAFTTKVEGDDQTAPSTHQRTVSKEVDELNDQLQQLGLKLQDATNGTRGLEEQTRILEKEKCCLEKELDRVQGERRHLKEELIICKSAMESLQSSGQARDLEQAQVKVDLEVQRLREANQNLEEECEECRKTIQLLEVKAKALDSLKEELHCFHEENDRLTQEVDIIQTTSKAMTDHELNKASLEQEKALLRSEFQSLKDHNKELQGQIKELSKVDKEKSEKLNAVEITNSSLENEVEKIKKMHEHLEQEFAARIEKGKELEANNEALKKENKAMKGRLKSLEQTNEELRLKIAGNAVKVNEEENRKTPATDPKSKGGTKRGRKDKQESKESQREDKNLEKTIKEGLLRDIENIQNEKVQLQEQLDDLRQKYANSSLVDRNLNLKENTVGTQTMEIGTDGLMLEYSSEKHANDEVAESEVLTCSALSLEDMRVGFSVMAKEKLQLEITASHFARVQMHLEQSVAKALKENLTLKNKTRETEKVLTILRQRVHELQSKNASSPEVDDQRKGEKNSSNVDSNRADKDKPPESENQTAQDPSEKGEAKAPTHEENPQAWKAEEKSCDVGPSQLGKDEMIKQKETLLKEPDSLETKKKTRGCDSRHTGEFDNIKARLQKQEQENSLLKREKDTLIAELEAMKHEKYLMNNELSQKRESCAKQEEEMKVLLSSYNQEKEALLLELKNSQEKLRKLQQVETDLDDVHKKNNEAERLITELEKDLVYQTDVKNELTRELQKSKSQLRELEQLEKYMEASKKENEELITINGQLQVAIAKEKDENNNLTIELENTKKQLRSVEKQLKNSSKFTSQSSRVNDRGIQADSSNDQSVSLKDGNVDGEIKPTNRGEKEEGLVSTENKEPDAKTLGSQVCNSYKNNQAAEKASSEETSATLQQNDLCEKSEETMKSVLDKCSVEITEGTADTKVTTSCQIAVTSEVENKRNRELDLCVEDFEHDVPREQSTPSEEKKQCRSPVFPGSNWDMEREDLSCVTQPSVKQAPTALTLTSPQQAHVVAQNPQSLGEMLVTELDLVSGINPTAQEGAQSDFKLLQLHLNLIHSDDEPQKASKDPGITSASESTLLPLLLEQSTDLGVKNQTATSFERTQQDLSPSTKRKLEWNISSLRSELQKVSEEKENGQHEIACLEEELLYVKREIKNLLSECESLRGKADVLQTQNEAVLKEQILNDEENEELQQSLQELLKEKQQIEEAKRELENETARLEIELSDAIESREAMEREILRMTTEGTHYTNHNLEGQLQDIGERYSKLETVLSCVLDENSKMTTELSLLQAENKMLKGFKIMEITDNFTQFSPRTTEDESDGEGGKNAKKLSNAVRVTEAPSRSRKQERGNTDPEKWASPLRGSQRITGASFLAGNSNGLVPATGRPSSPEAQEVGSIRSVSSTQNQADEEGSTAKDVSTDDIPGTPTQDVKVKDDVFAVDSVENRPASQENSLARNYVLTSPVSDGTSTKNTSLAETSEGVPSDRKDQTSDYKASASLVKASGAKRHSKFTERVSTSRRKANATEGTQRGDSDDHDSSMEAYTSSSLVSVTDLDISMSSDQISSEDSSVVGPELKILQRMQKELAETKCNNVLVKNELSIIRKHNSDLQNQVQKLLSRNNHLKQKVCDRTLAVKRMEKEVHSVKDENKRLQEQSLVLKEEMTRVEKDKAKFERNMSSTKSENKRLKTDLSNVKAECYRVMKELVNLQGENRRLQLEIEKTKEESQRIKEAFSLESVSQELSLWGSGSHGSRRSLQDKQLTPEPAYLHRTASSDLSYSQQQRQPGQKSIPDLSPLMLPKNLHLAHADGSDNSGGEVDPAQSIETVSIASTDRIKSVDAGSRQGSVLSFSSDNSALGESQDRDDSGNNAGKNEGGDDEEDAQETKGKNKKKIKTIFRKLQQSKKAKHSK